MKKEIEIIIKANGYEITKTKSNWETVQELIDADFEIEILEPKTENEN